MFFTFVVFIHQFYDFIVNAHTSVKKVVVVALSVLFRTSARSHNVKTVSRNAVNRRHFSVVQIFFKLRIGRKFTGCLAGIYSENQYA